MIATTDGHARVLHLINGEHYSGAERVQDLLAQRLPGFGYDVEWVCVKPGIFPDRHRARGTPLTPMPMRFRLDAGLALRVARLVRRRGHVLVHAHTPRTAVLASLASRIAGIPFVYHVHSPAWADSTEPWQNRVNALVERVSLRGVRHVIAVTAELRRGMLDRGIPGDRVSVVLNGVPSPAPLNGWRRPEQEWVAGMVALFRPRKGLEILMRAVAALLADDYPIRLRAVGPFVSEAYAARVRAEADALGIAARIDWAGFSDDVAAEYRRMHLFVLPSLFGEGLPMVLAEAMAAGVPIVATRVGGIAEAVEDGTHALLVEPGDADALARALHRAIDGAVDIESLRRAARRRQEETLSDVSMARGVARIYDRILAR